jgi:hypothetical protein
MQIFSNKTEQKRRQNNRGYNSICAILFFANAKRRNATQATGVNFRRRRRRPN